MVLFSILLSGIYLFLQLQYWYHWKKLPTIHPGSAFVPQSRISVIIPARNEASHIIACIDSIITQDYPAGLLEIIVVDDHSTDQTATLVKAHTSQLVRYISLKDQSINGGKKNALRYAIGEAKGEWIITTDADCQMEGDCLFASVFAYEKKGISILTGGVLITKYATQLETFQSYELAGLMLITGSGYQSGWHHMANGAFLSFSKKAFLNIKELRGETTYASGDDMFLMEAFAQKSPKRIGFLKNRGVYVSTHAEPTWHTFLNQRIRWSSKNKGLRNKRITLIWGFIWIYTCLLIISLILTFFKQEDAVLFFLILMISKILGDLVIIFTATNYYRIGFSLYRFLFVQVLQISYIIYIGFVSLTGRREYVWKDRRVQ